MNGIFVRWKPGEPRRGRTFDPLRAGHPLYNSGCVVCPRPLGDGTPVTAIAVGPHDEESRERHDEGRWYSAQAALIHERCADYHTEKGLDWLVGGLAIKGEEVPAG